MNCNNKKILYCIHVNWGWIKQRPHFLAEGLSHFYGVDVLSKRTWGEDKKNNQTEINLLFPFRLPFERFKVIKKINTFFRHRYLRSIVKDYDLIWYTAPTEDCPFLLSIIDDRTQVVYDCMDDFLEFPDNALNYDELFLREKNLYDRANLVICSSGYLRYKLEKRFGPKNILLVNNALTLSNDIKEICPLSSNMDSLVESSKVKIVYIGTISEWFDIDLCKKIVSSLKNVEIFLVGPCNSFMQSKLEFSGVHLLGPIEHKYVKSIMDSSDILIMPFLINELILSVNPVKLYEYINSGKPCLAPRYGESVPFSDFVYLYNNSDECVRIVKSIASGELGAKRTKDECQKFAVQNTWEQRVELIINEFDRLNICK